jgi:hypothetical protein
MIIKNIKKQKIINFIKEHWLIILITFISICVHGLALYQLGVSYTLNSDDLSYVNSGITFYETGAITMHGTLSAQIMPGMTFFIALLVAIFGKGTALWVALKMLWITMGISTLIVIYNIMRQFTKNKIISCIPCVFLLTTEFIWMNNIILTETPYMLLFTLLVYHSIKLAKEQKTKDYIFIIIYYMMAVFIRPNIGIFPIFLFFYLLFNKYSFKRLIKQGVIAGIILVVCLTPWTIRNYKHFDRFIPLTYGAGNPLLLGTYQGVGYPIDEELDYVINVENKMPEKMKYYLSNPKKEPYLTKYYSLEYDGLKAKYRMNEWWEKNPTSMIKSYLFHKPYILVFQLFYWKEILGVSANVLVVFRNIEVLLFVISSIIILFSKKRVKEWLFLMFTYGTQILIYSYTFAFGRYGITMHFFRYLIIGLGVLVIYEKIKSNVLPEREKQLVKGKKIMKVLMIIPAYNEELNIEKTVNKIKNYNKKSKNQVDYVVINDGSTDGTLDVCRKNKFNVINLVQNLGIGGAVQTGYKYAFENDYDIAIQFDGDGQHDENYIDALVKEIEDGNDFVIGSRFISDLSDFKSTGTRRFGIKILSLLIKLCTGKKIYDPTSGFRAANKEIIKLFSRNYPTEYPEPETSVSLVRKGYRVTEIPVKMHEREFGTSSIRPLKSIYYMFTVSIAIIVTSICRGDK